MHFKWDLLVGKDDASFQKDPSAPIRCVVVFFVLKESHSKTLLTCLQNLVFYFIFILFFLWCFAERRIYPPGKNFFRVKNIDTATTLLCVILVSLWLSWRKYLPVEIEAWWKVRLVSLCNWKQMTEVSCLDLSYISCKVIVSIDVIDRYFREVSQRILNQNLFFNSSW